MRSARPFRNHGEMQIIYIHFIIEKSFCAYAPGNNKCASLNAICWGNRNPIYIFGVFICDSSTEEMSNKKYDTREDTPPAREITDVLR